MKDNWSTSLSIILKEEGGNDDDPRDPGGRTSRGIIQREWDAYRKTHPNRPPDVWKAPQADVDEIYHSNYWLPYCDDLPSGVDLCFFNASVNSGRTQAVRELQRAVSVPVDGMMGIITLNSVHAEDTETLVKALSDQRREFYQRLKTFKTFGKGWMARTQRVEDSALKMVREAPVVHPEVDTKPDRPNITVSPKAPTSSVDKPTVSPETSGGVAAGAGGLIAVLQQIQASLQQFAGTFSWVNYILIAIVLISGAYMIWGLIKRSKAQAVT